MGWAPQCWAEPPTMVRKGVKSKEKSDFIRSQDLDGMYVPWALDPPTPPPQSIWKSYTHAWGCWCRFDCVCLCIYHNNIHGTTMSASSRAVLTRIPITSGRRVGLHVSVCCGPQSACRSDRVCMLWAAECLSVWPCLCGRLERPGLDKWFQRWRGLGMWGPRGKGSPSVSKGRKPPIQLLQLLKNSPREVKRDHFRYILGPRVPPRRWN